MSHGMAVDVHRQQPPRLRGHRSLDGDGVDAQRVRLDVHQHRSRAKVLDDVNRRAERHRRRDDLVARLNAERREPDLHRIGRRGHGQRGLRADELRKLRLELPRSSARS